jgi:hypothetical protein
VRTREVAVPVASDIAIDRTRYRVDTRDDSSQAPGGRGSDLEGSSTRIEVGPSLVAARVTQGSAGRPANRKVSPMTIKNTTQRLLVVLNLPRSVPALLVMARVILDRMTGNGALPSPVPTLAVLSQAIDDLQAAQVQACRRTVGAVATRNTKKTALVGRLLQLGQYIQSVADANRANRAVGRSAHRVHLAVQHRRRRHLDDTSRDRPGHDERRGPDRPHDRAVPLPRGDEGRRGLLESGRVAVRAIGCWRWSAWHAHLRGDDDASAGRVNVLTPAAGTDSGT